MESDAAQTAPSDRISDRDPVHVAGTFEAQGTVRLSSKSIDEATLDQGNLTSYPGKT